MVEEAQLRVIPSRDRQINPDLERFMAGRAKSETIELPGSRVIFLLHPHEVAAIIEKAARAAE
jgi:hypothetical protein